MNELYRDKKIILVVHQDQFFITLPQFHYSEKSVAQKINNLLSKDLILKGIDVDAVYQSLRMPDEKGLMLNEEQQRGIVTCLQSRVAIITGGPGTGKTTMIRRLIEVFERYKVSFKLAAPTGRAAKRMFESTGRSTETLHRLLEFSPGIMNFTRNEMNALECDVLVVDEASMIDIFLMNAIVKALPHNATLLLIGDIDQLPSVGPGNVLHDLIATKRIPTIRLQHIFRQAQDSFIIINAHRVNQGEFPTHPEKGTRSDFVYINKDKPEDLLSLLPLIYNKKLAQRGISAHDTMILTPMNRGVAGAVRLNQELQVILNGQTPQQESVSQFGRTFKVHDRVMQIRNNYDKFVFNGDIGVITSIHKADQKLIIRFGERDLEYDFAELNELMLAYAISIHKSQGSEFQAVIIPLFMQHFILLQRNLIYTAITRAKKLCIIIGQPRALAMGIKNDKGVDRRTFLKELLIDELEIR
jgi:exodeoxyribonuclease V alpha subunit